MSKKRVWLVVGLVLVVVAGIAALLFNPAKLIASQQQNNTDLIAERMAYNLGVQAYIYGYPFVDMHAQKHNETHSVEADQQVVAPVNRFYRFPGLVTPESSGNFRAPNNDTLYFSGWYDLSEQPVIIHAPDTAGRYYTIAVTNQYSEVIHIGRRTTGTQQRYFALTPPGWQGDLPSTVTEVPVATPEGWLLGRMLVDGPEDLPVAKGLVDDIWLAELDEFEAGKRPALPTLATAAEINPLDSLAFFEVMNNTLKELPRRERDSWLYSQFNRIGVGPDSDFDAETLDEPTRKGLELALEEGAALVQAATQRTIPSVNGWMTSREIGRYSDDYLHRASVVKGGYGNLPEESLYPAALFDEKGELLHGDKHYRLRFDASELPPVDGFWSLAVYRLSDQQLERNELARYSIGDRTEGLQYGSDGSLTIAIQHERPPADPTLNWLPAPAGHFMAVLRMYEPQAALLDGRYQVPPLQAAPE